MCLPLVGGQGKDTGDIVVEHAVLLLAEVAHYVATFEHKYNTIKYNTIHVDFKADIQRDRNS